jgi:hypothetical protein
MPSAWEMSGSSASHRTRRGEYAVALNCTITNVSENTIADSVMVPAAAVE